MTVTPTCWTSRVSPASVTNNSTKSHKGYKKKFDSLGLTEVPAEEIFSSLFVAAAYLEKTNFAVTNKKLYVIGEVGICKELDLIGVPYLGGPADKDSVADMGPGGMLHVDESVGAVVVAFDRNVNYYKIQYTQLCINELGAEFIATNLEKSGREVEVWSVQSKDVLDNNRRLLVNRVIS